MCGDAPDARTDGEGDFDAVVDGRLIALGAQRAIVVVVTKGFQGVVRSEHAAAAGAQNVPGEIEQAEPRRMQKSGNHLLLVETGLAREVEQIDAVEARSSPFSDQILDRIDDIRIGGLFQHENRAWVSLMVMLTSE